MVRLVPASLRTEFSSVWYSLEPGVYGVTGEDAGEDRLRTARDAKTWGEIQLRSS